MAPHSTEAASSSTPTIDLSSELVWKETDLDASKHLSHESVSSLFHTWTTEDCCFLSSCSMLLNESSDNSHILEGIRGDDMQEAHILELPPLSPSPRSPKRPLCTFVNFRGIRSCRNEGIPDKVAEADGDFSSGSAEDSASMPSNVSSRQLLEAQLSLDIVGDDTAMSLPSLHDEEELLLSASSLDIAMEECEEEALTLISEKEYLELKEKVSLEAPMIDKSLKNDKQLNEYLAQFHRLVAKAQQVAKEIEEEGEHCAILKKQRLV